MWLKIMSPYILLKSVSKWSTAVSLKKTPKSVSDTGNLYHVACLKMHHSTVNSFFNHTRKSDCLNVFMSQQVNVEKNHS